MPIAAGEMKDRFLFSQRALDGNGDRLGPWGADAITVATKLQYRLGSEAVEQQRLQGVQTVLLSIRKSAAAMLIDNGWRAIDTRNWTRLFDVTEAHVTPDGANVQILAVTARDQPVG